MSMLIAINNAGIGRTKSLFRETDVAFVQAVTFLPRTGVCGKWSKG